MERNVTAEHRTFSSAWRIRMAVGFIILEKSEAIAHIISRKLKKLWVAAELLLFVLVGAQVDIDVALEAGLAGTAIIFVGLAARSAGTYLF